MIELESKLREKGGLNSLRRKGEIPAIVYGSGVKEAKKITVEKRAFEKVFKLVGESSLFSLKLADKTIPVLIHEIQKDPLKETILHIDFYAPSLKEKVTALIPLVFRGEAPAVKELGGTLIKNFSEIQVKALAINLPHELEVDLSKLKTFEDLILIEDIKTPAGVEILRDSKEIVAKVLPPQKVEEELKEKIEEKVEEVKIVGKEKKEEISET